MSIGNTVSKMYEALGANKAQRFWRLFMILCLVSLVTVAGFKTGALKIAFTKQFSQIVNP